MKIMFILLVSLSAQGKDFQDGNVFLEMIKKLGDESNKIEFYDKYILQAQSQNEKALIQLSKDFFLCYLIKNEQKKICNIKNESRYEPYGPSLKYLQAFAKNGYAIGNILHCNLEFLKTKKKAAYGFCLKATSIQFSTEETE